MYGSLGISTYGVYLSLKHMGKHHYMGSVHPSLANLTMYIHSGKTRTEEALSTEVDIDSNMYEWYYLIVVFLALNVGPLVYSGK